MNRFTLRFAGAEVEAAFAEEQTRKAVRPVRTALACVGALSVGYYVLTIHVFKGIVVGIGARVRVVPQVRHHFDSLRIRFRTTRPPTSDTE